MTKEQVVEYLDGRSDLYRDSDKECWKVVEPKDRLDKISIVVDEEYVTCEDEKTEIGIQFKISNLKVDEDYGLVSVGGLLVV